MKRSLKNVRCETSVLFLIERSFNRGAIGYVPSFSLKVVFFSFFSSYGDKVPRTLLGRLFAIAWTLFGLVMISFLLADMTNALISYSLFKTTNKKVYGAKVSSSYELQRENINSL